MSGTPAASQRRLDIQGLRGLAVLLVILFHAGVPFLPGGYVGVDVFFVISGFVITSLLLGEADRKGGLFNITDFYLRRVRRLMPMAVIVLATVLVASWYVYPEWEAADVAGSVRAAAMLVANWWFIAQGADYMAHSGAPSPAQHFWSLSVEEQYYLIWPLLLALVWFTVRRTHTPKTEHARKWARWVVRLPRRATWILSFVFVASFSWSVVRTAQDQSAGYFSSLTRVWELAAGALVACWALSRSVRKVGRALPTPLAVGLSIVGLSMIAVAATTFTTQTVFPGYAALLPVAGTAMLIAAGTGAQPLVGVTRGLSQRTFGAWPLRWTGDISYSLYLWHWPFLIIPVVALGRNLTGWETVAAVVAAFGLSAVTYRVIEIGFARPREHPEWAQPFQVPGLGLPESEKAKQSRRGRWKPALAVTPALAAVLAAGTVFVQAGPNGSIAVAVDTSSKGAGAVDLVHAVTKPEPQPTIPAPSTTSDPNAAVAAAYQTCLAKVKGAAAKAARGKSKKIRLRVARQAEARAAACRKARDTAIKNNAAQEQDSTATPTPTPTPTPTATTSDVTQDDVFFSDMGPLSPEPGQAAMDWPSTETGCWTGFDPPDLPKDCARVQGDAPDAPKVAVIGDSHAYTLVPALDVWAEDSDASLWSYGKAACPLLDIEIQNPKTLTPYTDCGTWNTQVWAQLERIQPDLVVLSHRAVDYAVYVDGETVTGDAAKDVMADAAEATYDRLADLGANVLVVRDNPTPPTDIPSCLDRNPGRYTECAFSQQSRLMPDPMATAADSSPSADVADLTGYFCADGRCPAVIGGIVVYRDDDHMTATYSRTLAVPLGRKVNSALSRS